MKRGNVSFALILVLVAMLGACVKSVDLNPELMTEDEIADVENYVGSVRVETVNGIIYKAQTLKSAEGDSLHLVMVEMIDDGVSRNLPTVILPKDKLISIELQENNRGVVGGALVGIALMTLVLYYQINGSF